MLYTVFLQDTNGHRRLVGGGEDLSEAAADALINGIVEKHTKPHKVDYDKVGYTRETKAAVLASKQIDI